MNNKTLEALKGSIKKWEDIVDGVGSDAGGTNCPLCRLYYSNGYCIKCPVSNNTGKGNCNGTPYANWAEHFDIVHDNPWPQRVYNNCPECKDLAQKELDYLISLLPKGKEND